MNKPVNREMVNWAYKLFLGRDPENEQAVQDALAYPDSEALRQGFIRSTEFAVSHARFAAPARLRVPLDAAPLSAETDIDTVNLKLLLDHVQREWIKLGEERPHWSVLSVEQFTPESIGSATDTFFASGASDVELLLAALRRHSLSPAQFPRLFEYGCGLGRVTTQLARTFKHVEACDISRSHLDLAKRHLEKESSNAQLRLAQVPTMGMNAPFDLWFSRIVLQHNPPPVISFILDRALSLLEPRGVAFFQLPTYCVDYSFNLKDYLLKMPSGIEMHALPQSEVFRIVSEKNCELLEVREDEAVGMEHAWVSNQFLVRKRA
jgi:SAM-dependent methyltransferase